jgi:uncharacterized HhH-GPD family protein
VAAAAEPSIVLAFNAEADALLSRDPFALLMGMLLDQQMPMERAFAGPAKLLDRLGNGDDHLDPAVIAAWDPDDFSVLMATPPAVHRYPASMAGRVQALAQAIVDDYRGNTAELWESASSGGDLVGRLEALPGFGEAKARIFAALLGKQLGVRPRGWRSASAPYGQAGSKRSAADVIDKASLQAVREFKQQAKAQAKAAEAAPRRRTKRS